MSLTIRSRSLIWLRNPLPALVLLAAVALTVAGQVSERPVTGAQRFQLAVEKARPLAQWIVVQDVTGSFDRIEPLLEAFTREFTRQGLDAVLRETSPTSILVFREPPASGREFELAVGFTVPAPVEAKPPLRCVRLQADQAATLAHRGPYQELERAHTALAKAAAGARKEVGWPVVLRLLNDPRQVPPEGIRSELVVPLERSARRALAEPVRLGLARAVREAKGQSFWYVSQTVEGSLDQTGELLERFMKEFEQQGLGKALASPGEAPILLLAGDPAGQKTVRFELGFAMRERVEVEPPLAARQLDLPSAVSFVHKGSFAELPLVYAGIEREAAQGKVRRKATFPVALRLLTDPRRVSSSSELRTGLIVPLGPAG